MIGRNFWKRAATLEGFGALSRINIRACVQTVNVGLGMEDDSGNVSVDRRERKRDDDNENDARPDVPRTVQRTMAFVVREGGTRKAHRDDEKPGDSRERVGRRTGPDRTGAERREHCWEHVSHTEIVNYSFVHAGSVRRALPVGKTRAGWKIGERHRWEQDGFIRYARNENGRVECT